MLKLVIFLLCVSLSLAFSIINDTNNCAVLRKGIFDKTELPVYNMPSDIDLILPWLDRYCFRDPYEFKNARLVVKDWISEAKFDMIKKYMEQSESSRFKSSKKDDSENLHVYYNKLIEFNKHLDKVFLWGWEIPKESNFTCQQGPCFKFFTPEYKYGNDDFNLEYYREEEENEEKEPYWLFKIFSS